MKKNLTKIIFSICIIPIIGFYIWSNLLSISILLILILDSFTLKIIPTLIKKIASDFIYQIVKYAYIIILPVVFAIFFRTFFFDVYFVPSSSMERTLFPNDYVLVNKISYGVKLPKHLRNVAVIGGFFNPPENEYDLYNSLNAFKKLEREDIVVFKAVDDSDKFLIKRIIGMPSETIRIKQTKIFVNSHKLEEKDNYSYNYIYHQENNVSLIKNFSNKEFSELDDTKKRVLKKDKKEKPNYNYFLFPTIKQNLWTRDNYGKLTIPKKGMKIKLTEENIAIYNSVVIKFENVNLKKLKKQFYTFKNNYYFMMGDNRHNSIDSRSYGFIPESYIQGKMIVVF
tara:strand:- start:14704 stop:15723 length:1020 start_codon:yes stop_codon:yes gene_type:complete